MIKELLPKPVRKWLIKNTRIPAVGRISSDYFKSTKPISRSWGGDRGLPIDRYYIEKFLQENSSCIKGTVLEIGDNAYTIRFGKNNVQKSEILHAAYGNPLATYVGDLADIPDVPSNYFDCVICTQTLQLIPKLDSAINTLHRILKPGGTLLVSLPGISQIYYDPEGKWPDFWRFTSSSAKYLFSKVFSSNNLTVASPGNVLVSSSFLYGVAAEELSSEDLDFTDPYYEFIILVKAVK